MKGDGEGKMNAVEKQCIVHVCSGPAIVGSSQSVTLLSPNFVVDFKNVTQFIRISLAREIVKRFFIGSTPLVCHPYQRCRKLPHLRPTFATSVLTGISLAGESLCRLGSHFKLWI